MNGLLCCPLCDSVQVTRVNDANLASPKRRKPRTLSASDQLSATEPAALVPAPSVSSQASRAAARDRPSERLNRCKLRVRRLLNCDNCGKDRQRLP